MNSLNQWSSRFEPLPHIWYGDYKVMFIEVVKAEYIDGYRLLLLFNNGEWRIVDLGNSLNGTVYIPLRDINYFKRFSIKFNTVEWENGADFAPEYLYEISTAA